MTIQSHTTKADNHVQKKGERYIRHEFIDHLGKVITTSLRQALGAWTETEYLADRLTRVTGIESSQAEAEAEVLEAISKAESGLNPDTIAQYQSQAEFDRRFLGRSMLLAAYPFFACKAVYDRAVTLGNNITQRAAYLGILDAEWVEIDTRFLTIEAWDIDLEKPQQWLSLPEGFE